MAIILYMQGHVVAWRQAMLIRKTRVQPPVDAMQGHITTPQARFTGVGTEVDQGIFKLRHIQVDRPRGDIQLPMQAHFSTQGAP